MPESQDTFGLKTSEDEMDEIAKARLFDERVLRTMALVVDEEIGRKQVCWILATDDGNLSKQLAGLPDKDNKIRRPDYRLLRYLLTAERRDRLKQLILVEQGPCLPPQRRSDTKAEEVKKRVDERIARGDVVAEILQREIYGGPVQQLKAVK